MVLGCQEAIYGGSLQLLGSEDCTFGALWLEGNYLLGCLAGLLSGLLVRWEAWKLAVWLPHSKYHGSGLPREGILRFLARGEKVDMPLWALWQEGNYLLGCLAGFLCYLATWLP